MNKGIFGIRGKLDFDSIFDCLICFSTYCSLISESSCFEPCPKNFSTCPYELAFGQ